MPNWCENIIEIVATDPTVLDGIQEMLKGPSDAPFPVEKVYDLNVVNTHMVTEEMQKMIHEGVVPTEEVTFSFQKILPISDEEIAECVDAGTPQPVGLSAFDDPKSPLGLRIKRWGVKWNVNEVMTTRTPRRLIYEFSTAWSPPEPVIEELYELLSDKDVSISCYVYEPGNAFAFIYEGRDGNYTQDAYQGEDAHEIGVNHFGYEPDEWEDDDEED